MGAKLAKCINEEMLHSSQTPSLSSHYYGETNLDCIDSSYPLSILEISESHYRAASQTTRKMYQTYKGQLQLCMEVSFGELTVHVIGAKHLPGAPSDTFVQVSVVTSQPDISACHTDLVLDSSDPLYDEKFTYELTGKDYQSRVLISVICRDRRTATNTHIGCMSFGISSIAERKTVVDGWYYILTEELGEKKHMCVREDQREPHHQQISESSLPEASSGAVRRFPARFIKNRLKRARKSITGSEQSLYSTGSSARSSDSLASSPSASPQPGCYFRMKTNKVNSIISKPLRHKSSSQYKPMKMITVPVLSWQNNQGYGFSLSEGFPCKISKVETGSAAFRSGLRDGDIVVRVNGQSVHRMYPETVGRIIKHYPKCVILDIIRHSHKVSRDMAMSATFHFLSSLTNDSDQDSSEDDVLGSATNFSKNMTITEGMKGRKLSLGYVQLDGHPEMLDPSFSEPSDKPVFHQRKRDEEPRPVNLVSPTLKEGIVKDLNGNHVMTRF